MAKSDKPNSLTERALGPAADEFAASTGGAGTNLGEAGRLLAEQLVTTAKAVRVLLAPIRLLVYGYEQLEQRFIPLVQDQIAKIPEERRVAPPLLIAGPTIEAAKFATEEPEICKLFANLLATSMDASTRHNAHPSFVELITQLSPDEARILKIMKPGVSYPVVDLRATSKAQVGYKIVVSNISHLGNLADVERQDLTQASLDNLCRLGLCAIPSGQFMVGEGIYEPLENDAALTPVKEQITAQGRDFNFERRRIALTVLGVLFVDACVKEKSS